MRFGVRFDTKQQTGGSGEEPPVSSILESNSAKLRAKNSVLQSKMNNLCQISRQIFRRSFSRNSARYKTFMFLCQAPRLCQIDRLPCHSRDAGHGINPSKPPTRRTTRKALTAIINTSSKPPTRRTTLIRRLPLLI